MKLLHKRRRAPRYTVGSVSGTLIHQQSGSSAGGGQRGKPLPLLWYVHDSAFGYRIVCSTGRDEEQARTIAHGLNVEEDAWRGQL